MDTIGFRPLTRKVSIIMPPVAKLLTTIQLKKIKNKTVAVGGVAGLYYRNTSRQSLFIFRFQDHSGRHDISLGTFPAVSLAQARAKASRLRSRLESGKDILAELNRKATLKKESRQSHLYTKKPKLTFSEVAQRWHKELSRFNYWANNPKGETRAIRILEIHAYPYIGEMDINQVSANDVFNLLSKIWLSKYTTALKVKTGIHKIFQWAMAKNLCVQRENPALLSGSLGVLMEPLKKVTPSYGHFAACQVEEIPRLFAEIAQYSSISARACEFAILTCCRSKALRFATWDEIDLGNRLWNIPPEHDKIKTPGRDRRIFLSDQAVSVLTSLPKVENCKLLFPSVYHNRLSDAAITMFLRGLHEVRLAADGRGWVDPHITNTVGLPSVITLHGTARASFRTWAKSDTLGNNRRLDQEAVELCLFHSKKDPLRGAYDRANLDSERRLIMDAWGQYCFSMKKES